MSFQQLCFYLLVCLLTFFIFSFPTVWHGKSIYAMDEVTIAPPYTLEDCKAESSNSKSLAYVQRVLQGAREKLSIGNTQIKGG